MKIYTGNFANVKKYKSAGLEPISIALSARYFSGQKYKALNPDWSFKDFPEERYTPIFNQKLAKLDVNIVLSDLERMSGGKDIVLCCHEKAEDFCHRHLVADWITDKTCIEVIELGKMEEQLTIF